MGVLSDWVGRHQEEWYDFVDKVIDSLDYDKQHPPPKEETIGDMSLPFRRNCHAVANPGQSTKSINTQTRNQNTSQEMAMRRLINILLGLIVVLIAMLLSVAINRSSFSRQRP